MPVPAARALSDASRGAVQLSVMANVDNVQRSNYGSNSFRLKNTGAKAITAFELDVTGALYPDVVFDPEGKAGDSVAKALSIDTNGNTGIRDPGEATGETYIGEGGARGYRVLRLVFDSEVNDGFNPGETLGFSIDMDPNSLAGTRKGPLDAGSVPRWDVGGVSGAELIGSVFTVIFADGSRATGQLHSTNTQAGSHGLALEGHEGPQIFLEVNGLEPGQSGPLRGETPRITVTGPAGSLARVVVTRGFIQPVEPYADALGEQLETLAEADFPANNAVDFQVVDLELTGTTQDISERFDFSAPGRFNLDAAEGKPFAYAPDALPMGVVGAIIDPETQLPIGPVTQPVYLRH
jgi:hypothetical protein